MCGVTPFVEDDDTYEIIWGDTSAPVKVVTAPDKAPATLTHTKSTTRFHYCELVSCTGSRYLSGRVLYRQFKSNESV